MSKLNKLFINIAIVLTALTIFGCSDDDDSPLVVEADPRGNIRVIHASADAPPVNVTVDGAQAFGTVDYNEATRFGTVPTGTRAVAVNAITPGGEVEVLAADLTIADETNYDVIALNNAGDIEALVLTDDGVFTDESSVRIRVAHLTPAAPAVDIHVTAPAESLSANTVAVPNLAFRGSAGPLEIPAGSYRIRITAAGDLNPVFDSGTLDLAAGSDFLIGAVPNVRASADSIPVSLLVATGAGFVRLYDQNAGVELRAVHNVSVVGDVDIVVNDNDAAPLVEDLGFTDFTGYVGVPGDNYNIKIKEANNADNTLIEANVTLNEPGIYTAIAMGPSGDAGASILLLEDDTRRIATEARVRIIHGSTAAGEVDIYVAGADNNFQLDDLTPNFADVPFLAETGYVSLPADTYDIAVTPAGSKTAAITGNDVTFEAGKLYTIIARDPATEGGDLDIITLDDFNEVTR